MSVLERQTEGETIGSANGGRGLSGNRSLSKPPPRYDSAQRPDDLFIKLHLARQELAMNSSYRILITEHYSLFLNNIIKNHKRNGNKNYIINDEQVNPWQDLVEGEFL